MRLKALSPLLLCALLATTTVSVVCVAGWKPPPTGTWQCFRTDRFPDPAAERGPTMPSVWDPAWAADDHAATVFAEGMNKVVGNSAVGTVLAVQRDRLICVKY